MQAGPPRDRELALGSDYGWSACERPNVGLTQHGPWGSCTHGKELPGQGLLCTEQGVWGSTQSSGLTEHRERAEPRCRAGVWGRGVSTFVYNGTQWGSMPTPSIMKAVPLPLWAEAEGQGSNQAPMTPSFPLAESWVPASCGEGTVSGMGVPGGG